MQRLADLRPEIKKTEEAVETFNEIATLEVKIAIEDVLAEEKINQIKNEHAEKTAPYKARMVELKKRLASFIIHNKHLFKNPKKMKTNAGTFGLQKVTELKITDKELLMDALFEKGYDDCIKTDRKPIKNAIRKRMEDHEEFIPGVRINSGDTATFDVSKVFINKQVEASLK